MARSGLGSIVSSWVNSWIVTEICNTACLVSVSDRQRTEALFAVELTVELNCKLLHVYPLPITPDQSSVTSANLQLLPAHSPWLGKDL